MARVWISSRRVPLRVFALLGAQLLAVSLLGGGAQGSTPAAPPNCNSATQTFTNSTLTPILDTTTTPSTLPVSGVGTYLLDLDVTTNLQHTNNSDIDMFLISPAGTRVTLTTDNGESHDNVFNGTTWDDDADPGGPIPYVVNDGLASDQQYANNTVATPLVPEEALGAFVGENPNGTWTLSISDDFGGDIGTLTQWQLMVTTLSSTPTTSGPATFTNSTAMPIPTPGPLNSTVSVSGRGPYLLDVNVTTNISHTESGHLDIAISSPGGSVITLSTDNPNPSAQEGSSNTGNEDNVFAGTVWDDDAGSSNPPGPASDNAYADTVLEIALVPEEALGAAIGENPNGTWTLSVDDFSNPVGTLNSWSVHVTTGQCAAAPGCDISGTAQNNVLVGTGADETFCAKGGDDVVRARGGDDTVKLGTGNDLGKGGNGDDVIRCDGGLDDKGVGGAGNDVRSGCERGSS